MCVYVFSPGHTIHIDYAAESVTIEGGAVESIIDLLITNHSPSPAGSLSIVYPHPLPLTLGLSAPSRERKTDHGPFLSDQTSTWCNKNHTFNRFYDKITLEEINDSLRITVRIADPSHKVQPYQGWIKGRQVFTPYQVSEHDRLNRTEWQLLSHLNWSVATLSFTRPIETNEARWLRLVGFSGCLAQNRRSRVEHWARKLGGILVHNFEIAGPKDVRYRLLRDLKRGFEQQPLHPELTNSTVLALREALLTNGIEREGTETVIEDWRINLFEKRYRQLEQPDFEGDIVPSAPLRQVVALDQGGRPVEVFQWKAGRKHVPRETADGMFQVRLAAHDIPLIAMISGPLGLILSILGIVLALASMSC